MLTNYARITQELAAIRRAGGYQEVFGASVHRFACHPPLPEPILAKFEAQHAIRLPLEYRSFLLQVGNGGTGPAYGVFRLREMDDGVDYMEWYEQDIMVGMLSAPFPHTQPWNDLTGMPVGEGFEDEEYDRQYDAFERIYFRPLDGAFPICHRGCALRYWLVISGVEAGHIWCDDRADYNGLYPYQLPGLDRVSFYPWYRHWLDGILQELGTDPGKRTSG